MIRIGEFYVKYLEQSNARKLDQESLKASKELLKIAFGFKDPFHFNKKTGIRQKFGYNKKEKKVLDPHQHFSIMSQCKKYSENSHEITAYRMAFGLPTQYTKLEHEILHRLAEKIID